MKDSRSRRWRLLALFGAFALLASACGSDAESDTAADVSDTAGGGDESAAECETVDDVTLQLQWFAQAQFAGYYAAVDEGLYAKHCLNVTIVEGGVDIVPQQQLGSGAESCLKHWFWKMRVGKY